MLDVYSAGAAAVVILFFALWVASLFAGKVSFIDSFWGFGFVTAAWAGALAASNADGLGPRGLLALALVSLWGIRLGTHLWIRFRAEGEDKRYASLVKMRGKLPLPLFTFCAVFMLQAILIVLVSAPVMASLASGSAPLFGDTVTNIATALGLALFSIGLTCEILADAQLKAFKANPDNAGKVLDTGLWAWSRHPNYFGDALVWWGLWFISLDPVLVFAPAFMTFTLMRWSGKPILERNLVKSRPGYADYVERTSGFWPRPPKKQNP